MDSKPNLAVRIVGIVLLAGALVMVVAGGITWGIVSSELARQKVNVAAEGSEPVYANDPFDALSQVALIQKHTKEGVTNFGLAEGTVYAEIPMPDAKLVAGCKADKTKAATDECKTALSRDAARSYLDNSNFKQASLYTSVIAFGVAALVMGLGLLVGLVGWAFTWPLAKRAGGAAPTVDAAEKKSAA